MNLAIGEGELIEAFGSDRASRGGSCASARIAHYDPREFHCSDDGHRLLQQSRRRDSRWDVGHQSVRGNRGGA